MSTQLQTHAKAGSKSTDTATTNNAMKCHFSSQRGFSSEVRLCPIQTKLKIGQPGDKYEQEADRVSDQVMRMPEPGNSVSTELTTQVQPPNIQRMCPACEDELNRKPISIQRLVQSTDHNIQRQCTECEEEIQRQPLEEEEEELIQAKTAGNATPEVTSTISSGIQSLQGGGRPLSKSERGFFEPRIGADFSNVRVHDYSRAASVARSVNARAFTLGRNVVFGAGEFSSGALSGRKLLAHELTHVVQQGHGPSNSIQRTCGARAIGTPSGCTQSEAIANGNRYLYRANCDVFITGNEVDLRTDARKIQQGDVVELHGYASSEGDPIYNNNLSCARALKAKTVVLDELSKLGITATIRVFNHGATSGNRGHWRSVVLVREPQPQIPRKICGPDVTTWMANQIATAKRDRVIIALKNRLAGAERVARSGGFSAQRVAEGGVAKKVMAEWVRQGRPPMTRDAHSQLTASIPGQRQFGRALVAATSPIPFVGTRELFVLAAIRGAALTWKGLVGTGRKYDFKNRTETLGNPTTANCHSNCNETITLCPSIADNCFDKDVPGNIFYAHIGRFVGWSELILQLGSQFAQLESSASWDTPDDTHMINFAFNLPNILSAQLLCSEINGNRSTFDINNCSNCPDELDIAPV